MAVDTRDFYKLRWVDYHLDAKPIQILLSMYGRTVQRHDKKIDFCPICLWQNGLMPQKANWRKLFNAFSTI